jgi:hypothetical protein
MDALFKTEHEEFLLADFDLGLSIAPDSTVAAMLRSLVSQASEGPIQSILAEAAKRLGKDAAAPQVEEQTQEGA